MVTDKELHILLLIPFGLAIAYFLGKDESGTFKLEETETHYVVKTPNVNAEPITKETALQKLPSESDLARIASESEHMIIDFGKKNSDIVVRKWNYDKDAYDKERVQQIIDEKLRECPRCNCN